MTSLLDLRQSLRQQREKLNADEKAIAAQLICQHIVSAVWFTDARHVAFYWATRGEIDCRPLMQMAISHLFRCFISSKGPSPHKLFDCFKYIFY